MAEGVTRTLQDWNFEEQHVQVALNSTDFVSSQTTLICAGPAKLATTSEVSSGAPVLALGVVENLSVQQNQNIDRIYEIGSARSYLIPGIVAGGFNIGRLFIHGPSLLRSLYAAYPDVSVLPVAKNLLGYTANAVAGVNPAAAAAFAGMADATTAWNNYSGTPGYGDFFINLVSELFKRPIGVAVYMQDRTKNNIGAFYMEYSMITSHSMGWNAGGMVLAESASFQFDRVVPIDMRVAGGASWIEGYD